MKHEGWVWKKWCRSRKRIDEGFSKRKKTNIGHTKSKTRRNVFFFITSIMQTVPLHV